MRKSVSKPIDEIRTIAREMYGELYLVAKRRRLNQDELELFESVARLAS